MRSLQKSAWARALIVLALSTAATAAFAEESSSQVEKCSKNLGSIAVNEPQSSSLSMLSGYGLGSPATLLRMMIQQSGCFTVLERGAAMENIQQERALAQSGELRSGSNIGKGQMQSADFVITPNVLFSANTGGIGGGLTSWGGGLLGKVSSVAGNLKFKEAQTSLLLSDVRSSIQVAAAEGTAKKTDFGVSGWGWGGSSIGSLGGYTSTPEGKMVAASLLDNYNKIVLSIRDQSSLIRTSNASSDVNAAASTQAGISVNSGDMLRPKLNNIRVFAQPSTSSKVVGTVTKGDDLVATGEEKSGLLKVDAANVSGWVQKTLVMPAGGM
jgi:curli biogenesis system outer membrane secretion channel CsgG